MSGGARQITYVQPVRTAAEFRAIAGADHVTVCQRGRCAEIRKAKATIAFVRELSSSEGITKVEAGVSTSLDRIGAVCLSRYV